MQLHKLPGWQVSFQRNLPYGVPRWIRGSRFRELPPGLPRAAPPPPVHQPKERLPRMCFRQLRVSGIATARPPFFCSTLIVLVPRLFGSELTRGTMSLCHRQHPPSCVQCRNQAYLNEGVCISRCPRGFHEIGNGNYNRICQAAASHVACTEFVDNCRYCNPSRSMSVHLHDPLIASPPPRLVFARWVNGACIWDSKHPIKPWKTTT